MATFVEYELEDGSTVLVEVDEPVGGIVRAANDDGNVILKASKKFRDSLSSAKVSAISLMNELKDLPIESMEITFGLKSGGEAGFFAIGKVGLEANYQVKLVWKNKKSEK